MSPLAASGRRLASPGGKTETVPAVRTRRRLRAALAALPWILPGLLLFFVFVDLPMLIQIVMSFGPDQFGDPFVFRLGNFADLIGDGTYWMALGHNVQFAVATVTGKIVLSFILAVALNGSFRGRAFFRAVFFLPVVISFVAVGTVWGFILQYEHGAANTALRSLGFRAPDWLGDANLAMWSIILVDIWKWTGFHVVIYLAGLQALPSEVEEAAIVDGVRPIQRLWHLTVPMMRPYTATNVILATLGAFSVFDLVFIMTTGGPFNATQVAMTQIYLNAFQFQRFGYASAQATVLLAIMALVSVVMLRFGRQAQELMSGTLAIAPGVRGASRLPAARILVLAAGTLAIVYPLALFFLNSLKTDAQFIVDPLGLPTQWEFGNYLAAWVQADMSRLIFNSFLVSTASTLLAILMSSTFAFGLYAYRFPGAGVLMTSVVMMLTIPAQVYIIPLYVLVIRLHIIDTYLALILPYAAGAMPLSVVLFSNAFASLPRELMDAARVDGASSFAIYWRIVMPLARPVIGAIAVFAFTGAWNEFFLALVFMQDKEMFTLPLGMQVFATSAYSTQFTLLFAAFSISMLPMMIVYLLMQRQFIAGLAGGAMKG